MPVRHSHPEKRRARAITHATQKTGPPCHDGQTPDKKMPGKPGMFFSPTYKL
ncbi:hypothetical protein DENIT_12726 [Pseudomonas veronii]|nr:hypothetical protein DENIT_12726 [Pseudomonas veronii]